jgi:hypothetical protein
MGEKVKVLVKARAYTEVGCDKIVEVELKDGQTKENFNLNAFMWYVIANEIEGHEYKDTDEYWKQGVCTAEFIEE